MSFVANALQERGVVHTTAIILIMPGVVIVLVGDGAARPGPLVLNESQTRRPERKPPPRVQADKPIAAADQWRHDEPDVRPPRCNNTTHDYEGLVGSAISLASLSSVCAKRRYHSASCS